MTALKKVFAGQVPVTLASFYENLTLLMYNHIQVTGTSASFFSEPTDYVWEIGADGLGKLMTTTQKAQEYWQKYQSKILLDIPEWVGKG